MNAMTQDQLMMALIAEWEYKKSKDSCVVYCNKDSYNYEVTYVNT